VPQPELVAHEDHRLLDAHALLIAKPLVLGDESSGVYVAAKHLQHYFVSGRSGSVFYISGLGVVPMQAQVLLSLPFYVGVCSRSSLGRSPLPNALTSTLEPDVGLPVAHLLVLVYALAQLF
jgi:hypothetical protein